MTRTIESPAAKPRNREEAEQIALIERRPGRDQGGQLYGDGGRIRGDHQADALRLAEDRRQFRAQK